MLNVGRKTDALMNDDPIKSCTRLMLFQAQQDHATELVVRTSCESEAPVCYKVAEVWHAPWTVGGLSRKLNAYRVHQR